jgi:hypothetical protein
LGVSILRDGILMHPLSYKLKQCIGLGSRMGYA